MIFWNKGFSGILHGNSSLIIFIWVYFVFPTLGRTIGLNIFVATIQLREDDKNSTNSQTERNAEYKNCRATNNQWLLDGGKPPGGPKPMSGVDV